MPETLDRLHALGLFGPNDPPPFPVSQERRCSSCGCTEAHACWDEWEGEPCHWVDPETLLSVMAGGDVCSRCFRLLYDVEPAMELTDAF